MRFKHYLAYFNLHACEGIDEQLEGTYCPPKKEVSNIGEFFSAFPHNTSSMTVDQEGFQSKAS